MNTHKAVSLLYDNSKKDAMRSIEKNQILTGLKVIGLLLIIEAGFMFISLIAALWYGQGDATSIFLSALITL